MEPEERTEFKILIVDDNPKNIQVVGNLLRLEGHPTAFAFNGKQALEMIKADNYDLILLDIMMPGMDGFEVCEALKKEERTKDIPVIFLTAKADMDSIVKGFDLGAFDYVTKPFISQELLARVRSRLKMKSLNDELKRRYLEIKELEAVKETMTQMIVHDMKNPLNIILGYADLLQINEAVSADPQASKYITSVIKSGRTMLEMVMQMLDIARLESGQMNLKIENIAVAEIVNEAADNMRPLLKEASVVLKRCLPENIAELRADRKLLRRILANIIGNAIHYAPQDTAVTLSAVRQDQDILIEITDQGPGIPSEYHEAIFEKFTQGKKDAARHRHSTGLGLAFCKMATEALGGSIGVESQVDKGSTFWLRLPAT
ncbi:hybrid sensor histidine kinase/response regulator [Desulfococcaceae bacterium HSG9]|nr:hybrid sensor histidine kinase/response regulator [Desulfococcaceae bacterium HSG9]